MLFLENLIRALLIFNRLQSRYCQRALLGYHYLQGKDRRFIKDALLATVDGVEIRFTGEQLNQDDHDLLMQLIFMARATALGKWVTVSAYAILKALGRKVSGKQYRELRTDISRLAAGMVSIRNAKVKIESLNL